MIKTCDNSKAFHVLIALQAQQKGQRPPSPPRQMRDLSTSSILTKEFENYLKTEVDEENENQTCQILLAFVMQCDKVRQTENKKELKKLLNSMGQDFFNNPDRSKRVVLKNPSLRDDLRINMTLTSSVPANLWKAESDAFGQLDAHYQSFLKKRYQDKQHSLKACLL